MAEGTSEEGRDGSAEAGPSQTATWLRAWAWKREHRSDKERFHRPYIYTLDARKGAGREADGPKPETKCSTKLQRRLAVIRHLAREPPERACHDADIVLRQAPFGPEGFASTVWDSSIVVSKMLERSPGLVRGKLCWDLSAGCGLVAAVMARLGASHVVASDLAPNLPLLRSNLESNIGEGGEASVVEHVWGKDCTTLIRTTGRPTLLVACDVMYIDEAQPVDDLVQTLVEIPDWSTEGAQAIVAHGRNARGEVLFLASCKRAGLLVQDVPMSELHPLFIADDVTVLRITRSRKRQ